jgi:hypothetical protein
LSSVATKRTADLTRALARGAGVIFTAEVQNSAEALALAPDGSIVLGGRTAPSGCFLDECDFTPIVARFTASGMLDTGFGGPGWEPIEAPSAAPGNDSRISAVAVGSGGQIVAAGGDIEDANAYLVAREPSGGSDPSFGNGGAIEEVHTLPSKTQARGLGVGANGQMVVAVSSDTGRISRIPLCWAWRPTAPLAAS